jgi:hypothetical protein
MKVLSLSMTSPSQSWEAGYARRLLPWKRAGCDHEWSAGRGQRERQQIAAAYARMRSEPMGIQTVLDDIVAHIAPGLVVFTERERGTSTQREEHSEESGRRMRGSRKRNRGRTGLIEAAQHVSSASYHPRAAGVSSITGFRSPIRTPSPGFNARGAARSRQPSRRISRFSV